MDGRLPNFWRPFADRDKIREDARRVNKICLPKVILPLDSLHWWGRQVPHWPHSPTTQSCGHGTTQGFTWVGVGGSHSRVDTGT